MRDDLSSGPSPPLDSGLAALALALKLNGVPATPEQLRQEIGASGPITSTEMIRTARSRGLKARLVKSQPTRLGKLPLPCIAAKRDGGFLVLARSGASEVLLLDPAIGRPTTMPLAEFAGLWSGEVILIARRLSLSDLGREFNLSWFLSAVTKYRRIFAEVLIVSFFLQIIGLVSPLFFQVVIDKVLVHRGLSTLDVLIIGFGAVSLFEVALGYLRTYVFAHTTNRVDVELGARLFRHLAHLPMAYFEARRVGDSVARVRELENIRRFITGSALTLVLDLAFTLVFLAVMVTYSLELTLISVGAFPFYIGIILVISPVLRERLNEQFRRGAENQAFLVETVTGIETVKAMALEPQMQRRWEEQLASYVSSCFGTGNLNNVGSQLVGLVNKATTVLTLYFGAYLVMDNALSVGELVAFNMLAQRVGGPVMRLAQMWQDFQQVRVSVQRLGDILNTRTEPSFNSGRAALPPIRGDIRFEHVCFRYRPDRPQILQDIAIGIPAGQVVGIVGPSGSGKSTLTKLIQRLHVPETGRVLIDGVDLAMVDTAWLRRQVGVVLQENVLFNRSVRDNIAISDPSMSMEQVIAAAEMAGAHEFILELPEGYDTEVGERGNMLSGGQRQRIAIARALVTNPRILIFDEATSALDYESEQIIQTNMRRICTDRTVLIIAHRLSTVRTADRIITIERGRKVEDGTHDELLRSGGRYASLHRLQAVSS